MEERLQSEGAYLRTPESPELVQPTLRKAVSEWTSRDRGKRHTGQLVVAGGWERQRTRYRQGGMSPPHSTLPSLYLFPRCSRTVPAPSLDLVAHPRTYPRCSLFGSCRVRRPCHPRTMSLPPFSTSVRSASTRNDSSPPSALGRLAHKYPREHRRLSNSATSCMAPHALAA